MMTEGRRGLWRLIDVVGDKPRIPDPYRNVEFSREFLLFQIRMLDESVCDVGHHFRASTKLASRFTVCLTFPAASSSVDAWKNLRPFGTAQRPESSKASAPPSCIPPSGTKSSPLIPG